MGSSEYEVDLSGVNMKSLCENTILRLIFSLLISYTENETSFTILYIAYKFVAIFQLINKMEIQYLIIFDAQVLLFYLIKRSMHRCCKRKHGGKVSQIIKIENMEMNGCDNAPYL